MIESVRIWDVQGVRSAANAFRDAIRPMHLRAAPIYDITGGAVPVDADGKTLVTEVFGWPAEDRAWWCNPGSPPDCPLSLACRFESEPFLANPDGIRTLQANRALKSIATADFKHRTTLCAAIVAPVRLPLGQIGMVVFVSLDTANSNLAKEFLAYGTALGDYARVFITSYVRLIDPLVAHCPQPSLSPSEVECLRLAAVGKTDKQAAQLLSRSRSTVRFHLYNAAAKLNAANRSETVFRAAQLGYLPRA